MTKDLQKAYSNFDYHFEQMQHDLFELEKGYYHLDAMYQQIEKHMEEAIFYINKEGDSRLLRRLNSFKNKVQWLREKKGYDQVTFQKIFELVYEIKKNASNDIGTPALKEKNTFMSKDFSGFLAVQNGDFYFLISCAQKKWQKEIPQTKIKASVVKMKIPSLPQPNVFSFHALHGHLQPSKKKSKIAVLVTKEDNQHFGFFADTIEEKIFLEKKLLKSKTQFFVTHSKEKKPYILFKGERYFLIY